MLLAMERGVAALDYAAPGLLEDRDFLARALQDQAPPPAALRRN